MLKIHKKIIKEFVEEKKKDPKIVSILLFGSLAKGKAHKKSDIDLEIIHTGNRYRTLEEKRHGIKVDIEMWPKRRVIKRIKEHPFLSYPYLEEKILYDSKGLAKNIKKKLKEYFKKNPDIVKEWKKHNKKKKSCKKFYDELELKFSKNKKITRNF